MRGKYSLALRAFGGLAVAALSGVLMTLAFPPFNLWPLIFVGFVPAIIAQHRVVPARLSGLAYGVGLGSFYWGYFGPMFAGISPIMEWMPLGVAIIATVASGSDRAFHERTGYRWFVVEGAVVWVGIEAIRGFIPFIGTGGLVAYALYSQPWFIQPVGVFGIYGLGLVVMLVNYALGLIALALIDRRWKSPLYTSPIPRDRALKWAAGVGAVLVAWGAVSLALLGQATTQGPTVKVAALQPGDSPGQEAHTATLIAQTRQAAAQGAQLVIWPEGALNFNPSAVQTDRFQALARDTGAYIVIGYGYRTEAGLVNEALVVTPGGELLPAYGKDHPVAWMGETSVTGGTYPTHETSFGTLGTVICYDLNFTDTARKMAGNGARIIAVPSHDWPSLGIKQYTNLVMRAVENRVALVKADGAYDSAAIDPSGRILAKAVSTQGSQTILMANVTPGKGDTPFVQLGDWVGWLCIVGIVFFMGLGVVSDVQARRRRQASDLQARPLSSA